MIKTVKNLFVHLLICTLLFSLSSCSNHRNSSLKHNTYPEINWPEVGGVQEQLPVSADVALELTDQSTAKIYKAKAPNIPEICAYLKSFYNIADQWELVDDINIISSENTMMMVDLNTGYWVFKDNIISNQLYSSQEAAAISADQAIDIATEIAKKHNVDLDVFCDIKATPIECEFVQSDSAPNITTSVVVGYDVYLYPIIDGKSVWGISRFIVTVDGNGSVARVVKSYPELEFCAEETIITKKHALSTIMQGEGYLMSSHPTQADSIVINSCEIVYYLDIISFKEDNYCQPVYVFTGTYMDAGKEIEYKEYISMVPVLNADYFTMSE